MNDFGLRAKVSAWIALATVGLIGAGHTLHAVGSVMGWLS
jgi:hypothetical protein